MIKHFARVGMAVLGLTIGAAGGVALQQSGNAASSVVNTFAWYSYENCSTPLQFKDPIGTVFTFGNGSTNQVYEHAKLASHGGWASKGGGQVFVDDGDGCTGSDDSAATNGGGNGCDDRYHMRYEMAFSTEGGWSYASTPHFDDGGNVDWQGCHHCVPSSPSGFTAGKTAVYNAWYYSGHGHTNVTFPYWGNTAMALQHCGNYAGGNGTVHYIRMS